MATIITGRTTGYNPCFCVHRNYLYVADGVNRTIKVLPNLTSTRWMGIPAPATACTATSTSTGAVNGQHYYRYSFYDHNTDTESNPVLIASNSITVTNKAVQLAGIKPDTNAALSGTSYRRVYRTLTSGSVYFLLATIANNTTSTYTDSISDATLYTQNTAGKVTTFGGISTESFVNGVLPAMPIIENFKNYMMLCGDVEYSTGHATMTSTTAVTFTSTKLTQGMVGKYLMVENDIRKYTLSAIGTSTAATLSANYTGAVGAGKHYKIFFEPNRVYHTSLNPNPVYPDGSPAPIETEGVSSNGYIQIDTDDNDFITAGKSIGNDTFGVWKKYSVHAVSEINGTFIHHPVNGGIGCLSYRSMDLTLDKNAVYLASDSRFIVTNLSAFADVSSKKLRRFLRDYTAAAYMKDAHGIVSPENPDIYYCAIPLIGQTAYHIFLRAYMPTWDWTFGIRPTTCFWKEENSSKRWVYFGDAQGFYYKMNSGTTDGVLGGTTAGTITSVTSTSITDSTAAFYTTGDGLKGSFISLAGQRRRATTNTSTAITFTPSLTRIPAVGTPYTVGGAYASAYTKKFDLDAPNDNKTLNTVDIDYDLQQTVTTMNIEGYSQLYETGTLSLTQGATAATGTGTAFTTADIGKSIVIVNEPVEYRVVKVTTSTSINLENVAIEGGGYLGTTGSNKHFQMYSKQVTLPQDTNYFENVGIHQGGVVHQLRFGSEGVNKPWKINKYKLNFEGERK